jgi:hypothetical protein
MMTKLITFVQGAPRRRSDRLSGALAQLNDVLAVYAVGLALLDLVVYWRSCRPFL